ncbi:hypothetical protein WK90_33765 [Burkholderia cepacia]|nr:hypothetical protein WI67_24205 [Burkholderia cepacia]KML41579.1 hypothetical protein VL13_12520 [Burkholderia lata]KUY64293.1 hypothetical protein WI25_26695 [Burkholderia cepacia]KVH59965.1 hypothetical protein WJ40_24040 [Burkholderia cepacia]KVV50350.1 hypothetical protein WK83_33595 [Burkholderia cepacia]
MQRIRLGIAECPQDAIHEHVRLRQTLFRSAKAREVTRTDHQASIRALDVNIRAIQFFSNHRFAAQALDEQFAQDRVPTHSFDETPSSNLSTRTQVVILSRHFFERIALIRVCLVI